MDPTQLILGLLAVIGGIVSAAGGFIINGLRARLDKHGSTIADHGDRISRIEGARDAEKE